MKVKVGELKTHLSRYLRELQRDRNPIEVCVREKPVAYLTPADPHPSHGEPDAAMRALQEQLQSAGLRWNATGATGKMDFKPNPLPAGDGRKDVHTVEAMRSERNW